MMAVKISLDIRSLLPARPIHRHPEQQHWNTDKRQDEVTHVYTREAIQLRPDLSELPPVDLEELDRWIAEQTSMFES